MVDIQKTQAALEDLKHDLMRRLTAIDGDLSTPLDADGEDRAIEVENDDVLVAMRGEGAQQILDIDAALSRLKGGTYGRCTRCQKAIGDKRLAAVPYTPFCADCAKSGR